MGTVYPNATTVSEGPKLTKFNLDFPGGTPKQLVAAIEKAMGRPLNAIIPEQHADTKLPALKMSEVNVAELFKALEISSLKSEAVTTGRNFGGFGGGGPGSASYQVMNTAYGFRYQGALSDDTIWYFFVEKPALPPLSPSKACRFYALAPYLDRGQSVDDITTAIQTGWKMLGEKDTPTISFHKDTKLLIAVGDPAKLETIDAVLRALTPEPQPQTFSDRLNRVIQQAAPPTAGGKPSPAASTPKPAGSTNAEN
jgi:hypothetical protein